MRHLEAYKEHDGSTIYGKGIIRESAPQDLTKYNYVFENSTGRSFFNSADDLQVKNIRLLTPLSELEKLENIIK